MKLTATKALRYAGRSLVAGDDFEASAKDARLLKAIGKAGEWLPVSDKEATKKLPPTSDDAEWKKITDPDKVIGNGYELVQKQPKSAYRTRQMKAAGVSADLPVADEQTAEE